MKLPKPIYTRAAPGRKEVNFKASASTIPLLYDIRKFTAPCGLTYFLHITITLLLYFI